MEQGNLSSNTVAQKSFWFYAFAASALLVIGAVIGILSWQALRAGSGEASEEISAPTLDVNAIPTFSQSQAEVFATENASNSHSKK
jgi:hypothetical protein